MRSKNPLAPRRKQITLLITVKGKDAASNAEATFFMCRGVRRAATL
jgi:hypothetical protein